MFSSDKGVLCPELLLEQGKMIQFCGPNGIGKTSCIKIILDYLSSSLISFSYCPYERYLFPYQTIQEHLDFFFETSSPFLGPNHTLWPKKTNFNNFVFSLSQGQQQKINLCLQLKKDSSVWILDEPYQSLDNSSREILSSTIYNYLEAGGCVLLVEHLLDLIPEKKIILEKTVLKEINHVSSDNFA